MNRVERLLEIVEELRIYKKSVSRFVPRLHGLCPKCKEYLLIEGYVCEGCNYDRTANQN